MQAEVLIADKLMLAIHPQARTTPAVRAEIARSNENSGVPAKRTAFPPKTIRKWRKRGLMPVRIARRDPISCPGAPAMRSAPSCARSAGPPASPSTR